MNQKRPPSAIVMLQNNKLYLWDSQQCLPVPVSSCADLAKYLASNSLITLSPMLEQHFKESSEKTARFWEVGLELLPVDSLGEVFVTAVHTTGEAPHTHLAECKHPDDFQTFVVCRVVGYPNGEQGAIRLHCTDDFWEAYHCAMSSALKYGTSLTIRPIVNLIRNK